MWRTPYDHPGADSVAWLSALRPRGCCPLHHDWASIRRSASGVISDGGQHGSNRFPKHKTKHRGALHLRSNPLQKRSTRLNIQVLYISPQNWRLRARGKLRGGLRGEATVAAGAVLLARTFLLGTTHLGGQPCLRRGPRMPAPRTEEEAEGTRQGPRRHGTPQVALLRRLFHGD